MYENKILKSNEGNRNISTGNKSLQRKSPLTKLNQHAVMASNNFSVANVTQYKKIVNNNLINIKPLQMEKENNTGMPDQLKTGIESLSGIDMSDVRVHYNSDKPAGVGALAYTQGRDIHVATGQERHLAHEAWHVVQQAQGRVQPTTQFKDVAVNDDPGLEHEADVMGKRALRFE